MPRNLGKWVQINHNERSQGGFDAESNVSFHRTLILLIIGLLCPPSGSSQFSFMLFLYPGKTSQCLCLSEIWHTRNRKAKPFPQPLSYREPSGVCALPSHPWVYCCWHCVVIGGRSSPAAWVHEILLFSLQSCWEDRCAPACSAAGFSFWMHCTYCLQTGQAAFSSPHSSCVPPNSGLDLQS